MAAELHSVKFKLVRESLGIDWKPNVLSTEFPLFLWDWNRLAAAWSGHGPTDCSLAAQHELETKQADHSSLFYSTIGRDGE